MAGAQCITAASANKTEGWRPLNRRRRPRSQPASWPALPAHELAGYPLRLPLHAQTMRQPSALKCAQRPAVKHLPLLLESEQAFSTNSNTHSAPSLRLFHSRRRMWSHSAITGNDRQCQTMKGKGNGRFHAKKSRTSSPAAQGEWRIQTAEFEQARWNEPHLAVPTAPTQLAPPLSAAVAAAAAWRRAWLEAAAAASAQRANRC